MERMHSQFCGHCGARILSADADADRIYTDPLYI